MDSAFGRYIIDEKTKEAMTEATANGCQVIVMLAYGNWLYHHEPPPADVQGFPCYLWDGKVDPTRQEISMKNFPAAMPPAPITREHIDAYKRWVREMVTQFKGGFWSESASVPYSYSLAWSVAIVAFFLPRPHPRMGRAGDIHPGPA